jgi:hypothetical protein
MIIAAMVYTRRMPWDWFGEVYTNGANPVEGATVLLIRDSRVAESTTTRADGTFSFAPGLADSAERVLVCKKGFEPSLIEKRPSRRRPRAEARRQGSVVQLYPDNPDFEPAYLAPLRTILPSVCR